MAHAHIYAIKTPTASCNRTDKGWKVATEEDLTFKNYTCNHCLDSNIPFQALEQTLQCPPLIPPILI